MSSQRLEALKARGSNPRRQYRIWPHLVYILLLFWQYFGRIWCYGRRKWYINCITMLGYNIHINHDMIYIYDAWYDRNSSGLGAEGARRIEPARGDDVLVLLNISSRVNAITMLRDWILSRANTIRAIEGPGSEPARSHSIVAIILCLYITSQFGYHIKI